MDVFKSWLRQHDLEQYHTQLIAEEVEAVNDLTLLEKDELITIARKVGMDSLKTRKKFLTAVQNISDDDDYSSLFSDMPLQQYSGSPPAYSDSELVQSYAMICPEHDEPIKLICCEDNQLLCVLCVATSHHGHKRKLITDAVLEVKKGIHALIVDAKQRADEVDEGIIQVKAMQTEIIKRDASVRDEIQLFCEEIRQALHKRERALLAELDGIVRYKTNTLSQQVNSLTLASRNIHNLVRDAEVALSEKNQSRILQSGKKLRKQFSALSVKVAQAFGPETGSDITFIPHPALLASLASGGKVSDTTSSAEHTRAEGDGLIRCWPGKSAKFTIFAKDKDGLKRKTGGDVFTVEFKDCQSDIKIQDAQNGSYIVEYRVRPEEKATSTHISVLLGGKQTQGSPFNVSIDRQCQGTFIRDWGSHGDGGGQFSSPYGVAVDGSDVYVADCANHRIQVFRRDGTFVRMWGTEGRGQGQLKKPTGVVVDGDEVFVVEYGNDRIQVFRRDGTFIRLWGSSGKWQGQFSIPFGLAVEGDSVYVADNGNHRIQVFSRNGNFLRMWGSKGTRNGQFNSPMDVVVDGDEVYVADCSNHRIEVFQRDGTFLRTWGSRGPTQCQFKQPYGLAFDKDAIYVVDQNNSRIQVFRRDGTFIRMWGSGGSGQGQFYRPGGVVVESNLVYVTCEHRIQVFS